MVQSQKKRDKWGKETHFFIVSFHKNFTKEFLTVFNTLDEDLVDEIGKLRKEKDRMHLARVAVEEAYSLKESEIGDEVMRKVEREVYLKVLDALWMQHLENMQHLHAI